MVTLPYESFIKRVARMIKRELMKSFDASDVESIVKGREELKALQVEARASEAAAAMSEKRSSVSRIKVVAGNAVRRHR